MARPKPAPDIVQRALELLDVPPEEGRHGRRRAHRPGQRP
ncbi:hypothetical protein LT493_08440 [Streptomyces tricolor]|nr:hypothetical protein [Streptomyces tricolor]